MTTPAQGEPGWSHRPTGSTQLMLVTLERVIRQPLTTAKLYTINKAELQCQYKDSKKRILTRWIRLESARLRIGLRIHADISRSCGRIRPDTSGHEWNRKRSTSHRWHRRRREARGGHLIYWNTPTLLFLLGSSRKQICGRRLCTSIGGHRKRIDDRCKLYHRT